MTLVLALVIALATFALVLRLSERRRLGDAGRRISAYVQPPDPVRDPEEDEGGPRRARPLAATERRLARLPRWSRFVALVERADTRPSAVELFVGLSVTVVLLDAVALATGAGIAAVLVLTIVPVVAARLWLALRISRRRRAFDGQLAEFLFDVGAALRAGHGFNQALQAVTSEAPEPTATEFGRVIAEAQLGRPLEDSLRDLGGRIGSRDLQFVIEAIIAQRQVGGSLAAVFEIVSESVRQRQQYALRVRALTAMGRLSALVVLALPFALGLVLSAMNHGYLRPLIQTGTGRVMVIVSLALVGVGTVWLRALVSVDGAS